MARHKGVDIDSRELYLLMQSVALAMQILRGKNNRDSEDLREADDLWLKLEDWWDSLSVRERRAGSSPSPFNVRGLADADAGYPERR